MVKRLVKPIEQHAQRVGKFAQEFQGEYKKNLITALSAGLAFLIGFYVKDTLTEIVNYSLVVFGIDGGAGIIYKFVIMLIVVGLGVFGIMVLSKKFKN